MTVGLFTSPLPFMLLGAVFGSIATIFVGLLAAEVIQNRRRDEATARITAERRYELALRDVLAACDRREILNRIRRIARRGLHPHSLTIDDEPVIPEISHG